jgi:hypothetical protein
MLENGEVDIDQLRFVFPPDPESPSIQDRWQVTMYRHLQEWVRETSHEPPHLTPETCRIAFTLNKYGCP